MTQREESDIRLNAVEQSVLEAMYEVIGCGPGNVGDVTRQVIERTGYTRGQVQQAFSVLRVQGLIEGR